MVLSNEYVHSNLHEFSKKSLQDQKSIQEQKKPKSKALRGLHSNPSPKPDIPVFETAISQVQNPSIPDPKIFDFSTVHLESDGKLLPTVAQCAAHLELLEAFYNIRVKLLSSVALDTTLGIKPNKRTVYRKEYWKEPRYRRKYTIKAVQLQDNTFQNRRTVKWPFYLSLASVRFLCWAAAVQLDLDTVPKPTSIHLPPIDILIIWHSLLLNPTWLQSLDTPSLKFLRSIPFPWHEIHKSINSVKSNWRYTVSDEAANWFIKKTGLEPNLLKALTRPNKSTETQQLLQELFPLSWPPSQPGIPTPTDFDDLLNRPTPPDVLNEKLLKQGRSIISRQLSITLLVEAAQRQASFAEKMHKQLWIRSPVVEGTLSRAIDRYSNFLKLFKFYPRTVFVPTLDIDLIWHTHQCTPYQYDAMCKEKVGRLINHDDKIGKSTLDTGFAKTDQLYRMRFGEEYRHCNCWDCETLLSAVLDQNSNSQSSAEDIARDVQRTVAYYRAVEVARQAGETLLPVLNRNVKSHTTAKT